MKKKGTQKRLIAWTMVPNVPGNSQCMKTTNTHASPLIKSRQLLYRLGVFPSFGGNPVIGIPDNKIPPTYILNAQCSANLVQHRE